MDRDFLKLFMDKTDFPEEAKAEVFRCGELLVQTGQEKALDGAVEFYYDNNLDVNLVEPMIQSIGEESGINPYTVWLLFLIQASQPAIKAYLEKGIPEDIVWDTFSDVKFKLLECKNVHGVWGNFVAHWYHLFFSCDIVKLGRMEYESTTYDGKEPYESNGIIVKPGDPVKSVHIPSSGEPFDKASRLASYKQAYEFFKDELHGGPLVCVCHSWLLYPENREILSPSSNIVSFMGDFDVRESGILEDFPDAWRVFGGDAQKPTAQLPENTSMQRSFKNWLLVGKKTGFGFGIMIFDGEKIVNQ